MTGIIDSSSSIIVVTDENDKFTDSIAEVEISHDISVVCVLCDAHLEKSGALDISEARDECASFSGVAYLDVLCQVLQVKLSVSKLHSKYLCTCCIDMLDKYDMFVKYASDLQNYVKRLFDNSRRNQPEHIQKFNESRRKRNSDKVRFDKLYEEEIKQQEKADRDDPDYKAFSKELRSTHSKKTLSSVIGNSKKVVDDSEMLFPYSCYWCGFRSKLMSDVEEHKCSNICTVCGVAVKRVKDMRKHMALVHCVTFRSKAKSRCFTCKNCHKAYETASGLQNHNIKAHSGLSFKCKFCDKAFNHPAKRAAHEARHKEKSVKCTECRSFFFSKSNLNKHINQVHRNCKPYVCIDCGTSFTQRSVLNHHVRVHSDHQPRTCPLCKAVLNHKVKFASHLEEHERALTFNKVRLELKSQLGSNCEPYPGKWLKNTLTDSLSGLDETLSVGPESVAGITDETLSVQSSEHMEKLTDLNICEETVNRLIYTEISTGPLKNVDFSQSTQLCQTEEISLSFKDYHPEGTSQDLGFLSQDIPSTYHFCTS